MPGSFTPKHSTIWHSGSWSKQALENGGACGFYYQLRRRSIPCASQYSLPPLRTDQATHWRKSCMNFKKPQFCRVWTNRAYVGLQWYRHHSKSQQRSRSDHGGRNWGKRQSRRTYGIKFEKTHQASRWQSSHYSAIWRSGTRWEDSSMDLVWIASF